MVCRHITRQSIQRLGFDRHRLRGDIRLGKAWSGCGHRAWVCWSGGQLALRLFTRSILRIVVPIVGRIANEPNLMILGRDAAGTTPLYP